MLLLDVVVFVTAVAVVASTVCRAVAGAGSRIHFVDNQ